MGLLRKIYNRVNVVRINYVDKDNYLISIVHGKYKAGSWVYEDKDVADAAGIVSKYPSAVVITGYGVLSKRCAEDKVIADKVISDPGNFLFNYCSERTSVVFVRKTQIESALKDLYSKNIQVITLLCSADKMSDQDKDLILRDTFTRVVTYKNILLPGAVGSILALHIFNRIKIAVLAVILALLVLNAFASPKINQTHAALKAEQAALHKIAGQTAAASQKRDRTIAEFSRNIPYRYAYVLDIIGSSVPEEITLTHLSVQPLVKSLEHGKNPQVSDNKIVIRGEAERPENISLFALTLDDSGLMSSIKLVSIDRSRDNRFSVFQIDGEL